MYELHIGSIPILRCRWQLTNRFTVVLEFRFAELFMLAVDPE